jgi:hypothetical protein
LFISGDIKSGSIEKGMKIDLTFFGVAKKPTIDFWEYLDFISESRAEISLDVIVKSEEEKEYLKMRKSLAVPIIIERDLS